MYGEIRAYWGGIFHELARQMECRIMEGHLLVDHVHMCIEIPPKHAVAYGGFPCLLTPLIRQRGTKLHECGSYPYPRTPKTHCLILTSMEVGGRTAMS